MKVVKLVRSLTINVSRVDKVLNYFKILVLRIALKTQWKLINSVVFVKLVRVVKFVIIIIQGYVYNVRMDTI